MGGGRDRQDSHGLGSQAGELRGRGCLSQRVGELAAGILAAAPGKNPAFQAASLPAALDLQVRQRRPGGSHCS